MAAPRNASEMAVFNTSAIVMVMFRRIPAATPDITKLARMRFLYSLRAWSG
jgi:hypothetical protein